MSIPMPKGISKTELDRIFSEYERIERWKERVRKLYSPERVSFT